MKNCEICHTQLGEFEESLNWKYHEECKNCHYCGQVVQIDLIAKQVKDEKDEKGNLPDVKLLIFHPPCRDTALLEEYKRTPVVITQEHLDSLNRAQLMMNQIFHPNADLSIETNQELIDRAIRPWFSDLNTDEMYRCLMQLQKITAACSIVLGTKGKHSAQVRISEREKEKFQRVREIREDQTEKKQSRQLTEAEKIQRQNERADPQARIDRKALESLMTIFGLSEEVAREQLMKSKQAAQGGQQ